MKVRQSDCLRAWGRGLGSWARGKKKRITYTLAVTSVYQKLNNLPRGLGKHSPRRFTALVQTFWHVNLPVGFCGGSIMLQLLHVSVQLSLIVPFRCVLLGSQWSAWCLQGFVPQSRSLLCLSALICSCLAFAVSGKLDTR